MASIDKVGAGWRARWRTPDGQSRSKTFVRKVDAENHLTSIQHSKLTGAYVDPSAGRATFKAFAEGWRAAQVHRRNTAAQIETNLRLHVYPRIGHRPIGAIRPSEIQALVKWLAAGDGTRDSLAPSSIALTYGWVRIVFRAAVADRIIGETPCRGVSLPAVEDKQVYPLPVETIENLMDSVPDRYRGLIVLGAGTGVRISEALGLTNDRIHWIRREVTIDRQLVGQRGGQPVFGPVKDKKNRPRTIPLPQTVVEALAAHVARYGLGPAQLLFTGVRGAPVARQAFSKMWIAAAEPLGIPLGNGYHQLRHFYASTLIANGVSVKVVQKRLGHATAKMTLDVYAHLWPEDEDRTRDAIDAVFPGERRDTNVTREGG